MRADLLLGAFLLDWPMRIEQAREYLHFSVQQASCKTLPLLDYLDSSLVAFFLVS